MQIDIDYAMEILDGLSDAATWLDLTAEEMELMEELCTLHNIVPILIVAAYIAEGDEEINYDELCAYLLSPHAGLEGVPVALILDGQKDVLYAYIENQISKRLH